jgi:gliding motility-associated-like protein
MKMGPYIVKEENLNIPNVFSPNGDGLNDFFRIAYEGDEAYHLQIYDRWGVKYFDTRNKEQGWDGKDLNGSEGAEGVYFYSLEIGPFSKNGTIMLIR